MKISIAILANMAISKAIHWTDGTTYVGKGIVIFALLGIGIVAIMKKVMYLKGKQETYSEANGNLIRRIIMIYVLGKSNTFYDDEGLEDVVYMASTKITDILDYLFNNVRLYHLRDYIILAFEEGKLNLGIIYTLEGAYESFVKYRPTIFLREENEEEFQSVSAVLRSYCNKVKEEIRKDREEEAQKNRAYIEKQERELYEKLKAKYGE